MNHKSMNRKRNSNDQKLLLVLKALLTDAVITQFCKQHGISRSSFYRKRKALLTRLSEGSRKG